MAFGSQRGWSFPSARQALGLVWFALMVLASAPANADELPSPLRAADVMRIARARRPEGVAARARADAASARPRSVSALNDPMVMASIDHLPFRGGGANWTLTVQQDFPISSVLGDRKRAAQADADRLGADAERVSLDLELDGLDAFFALAERRATASVLAEQASIIGDMVTLARAHYASGLGTQLDVLRLENEAARIAAERRALAALVKASEAQLNTALARDPQAPVPELSLDVEGNPPAYDALLRDALARRPELRAARAERTRAEAETEVARSQYSPTGFVRAGPSYTMTEGPGVMVMLGVSVPIWRGRLQAGISEARATARAADAEIEAARRMIAGEIASSRQNVLAAQARLTAIQDDVLPRARRAVSSGMGSFGAGQIEALQVLEAARDLFDVRNEQIKAEIELGMSWARLRRASGVFDRGRK